MTDFPLFACTAAHICIIIILVIFFVSFLSCYLRHDNIGLYGRNIYQWFTELISFVGNGALVGLHLFVIQPRALSTTNSRHPNPTIRPTTPYRRRRIALEHDWTYPSSCDSSNFNFNSNFGVDPNSRSPWRTVSTPSTDDSQMLGTDPYIFERVPDVVD